MDSHTPRIVTSPISRGELTNMAQKQFGDMLKAVVDVERSVMAIGAELHSDEEAALLDDGSRQADLWGINLYPADLTDDFIEFDSMINVRPAQDNRSRDIQSTTLRSRIREVVAALVRDSQ